MEKWHYCRREKSNKHYRPYNTSPVTTTKDEIQFLFVLVSVVGNYSSCTTGPTVNVRKTNSV